MHCQSAQATAHDCCISTESHCCLRLSAPLRQEPAHLPSLHLIFLCMHCVSHAHRDAAADTPYVSPTISYYNITYVGMWLATRAP